MPCNFYDYGARWYDPVIGRFSSIDAHANGYSEILPYAYVKNNPLNAIDPTGRDIIVLSAPNDALGFGHAAVLIGNSQTGYYFYSKNGTENQGPFGPSKNPSDGIYFKTLDDFKVSQENKTADGGAGYQKAYELKADVETDAKMKEVASEAVKSNYNVLADNCIDVASKALKKSGFNPGTSNNGFLGIKNTYLTPVPNVRFNNIIKDNPQGSLVNILQSINYFYLNGSQTTTVGTVSAGPLSPPTFIPDNQFPPPPPLNQQ